MTSFLEDDTGEAFDSLFGTPQPKEETPDQPPSIEAAAQEPPVPTVPEPKTEPTEAPQEQGINPFDAAFRQGQAQSRQRLKDAAAAQPPLFAYEKAEDPITDASLTFEQLRQKYQGDYPALSDPKTVSWSITYGKITKAISMPGSDRVYDVKAEIEGSDAFIDCLEKAKKEDDKHPRCLVKPRVTFQKKGEAQLPAYKEFCSCEEEAAASDKPLVLFPGGGGVYQMRKTDVGIFVAPAELPEPQPRFDFNLPLIPICLLYSVIHFFRAWSGKGMEAMVHVLYDAGTKEYLVRVPNQTVTRTQVDAEFLEPYPDEWIHVMDIHSHNTMAAVFSGTDDADEKATRLYAVMGRFDKAMPDIRIRAGCAGKFIDVSMEQVFDTRSNGYPYPADWDDQVHPVPAPAEPDAKKQPVWKRIFSEGWRDPYAHV